MQNNISFLYDQKKNKKLRPKEYFTSSFSSIFLSAFLFYEPF